MAHRAWRLRWESSPRGYCSCATLQMQSVVGGPDITQGAPGQAIWQDAYSGYPGSYSFDNNPNSFWSSGGSNSWVGWDFGAGNAVDVQQLVYYPRPDGYANNDAPSTGVVEYSDDLATWTVAYDIGNQSDYQPNVARVFSFPSGPVAPAADATLSQVAIVVPSSSNVPPAGGARVGQIAIVSVNGETAPVAGGATLSQIAIVTVSIELPSKQQLYGYTLRPLWGFPLLIQGGI